MGETRDIAQAVPAIKTPSVNKFKSSSQINTQRKIQSFFTKSPANSSPITSNRSPKKQDKIEVGNIKEKVAANKEPHFEKSKSTLNTTTSHLLSPNKTNLNEYSDTLSVGKFTFLIMLVNH